MYKTFMRKIIKIYWEQRIPRYSMFEDGMTHCSKQKFPYNFCDTWQSDPHIQVEQNGK